MEAEKVYRMDVSKVYPLLVSKAVKKGRTKAEVDKVTCWLTGYSQRELEELLNRPVSYAAFFQGAPALHENRRLIRGSVCGIKVEEIEAEYPLSGQAGG